jgi:choline transporter-like protein 2/4/5
MGVGRCGGEEDEEYDPSNRGPNSKRGCTDVPCLLLLLAFIGGWIGVGAYSFTFGNPAQLIYPSNSEGEICGRGEHADRPFLLFFDLTRCAKISSALTGCPTPQVHSTEYILLQI